MAEKQWPSLAEASHGWKFEGDEVVLDHIRYWVLKATEMGYTHFEVAFNKESGTYTCRVVG